ncbi:MAG TPA: hypothetical protein VGL59_21590 [Polyangia bacterium]
MTNVLRLYRHAAAQAARQAVRAWPLALALPVYVALILAIIYVTSSWGFVAGIAAGFGLAAVGSSYLHLLALAVAGQRITLVDIKQSFGARIWDVVSVMFAFFIINMLVSVVVGGVPKGQIIATLVTLAMAVFFNPVPELLYQSQTRSFGLLIEAARFISTRGLEWLFPNVLLGLVLLLPTGVLDGSALGARLINLTGLFSLNGLLGVVLSVPRIYLPLLLAFLHWAMIFRGLLYLGLSTGGGRQQAVREKWGRR